MRILKYRLLEEAPPDGGSAGGSEGGNENQPSESEVREARQQGWVPQERWRGKPEEWVDARTFLERGKTFIPYLNNERRRLQQELEERDRRHAEELRQVRESVSELADHAAEMAKERAARRKEELGARIRAAREAGDDVRVSELQTQLKEVTDGEAEAVRKAQAKKENTGTEGAGKGPEVQPWLKGWISGNQDFLKNPRKTAMLNAIVQEKRQAGDERVGAEFMDEIRDEVEEFFDQRSGSRGASRTEESRSSGSGGGGRSGGREGKSYADMPAEARARCDKDEKRYVGPTKVYKTQAEWRSYYASEYFK